MAWKLSPRSTPTAATISGQPATTPTAKIASTTAPPSTNGQNAPATARPISVRMQSPKIAPGTAIATIPSSTKATELKDASHLLVPYQIEPTSPGASSPISLSATWRVIAVPKIDQTSTNHPLRAHASPICGSVAVGLNGRTTNRTTPAAARGSQLKIVTRSERSGEKPSRFQVVPARYPAAVGMTSSVC